ncbi:MAG: hypothetical protein HC778_07425 [Chamaesiphon sp. CSU_1_12]|nr:hypothetical protein [Chamaesiphon sp. CSU_1_12]
MLTPPQKSKCSDLSLVTPQQKIFTRNIMNSKHLALGLVSIGAAFAWMGSAQAATLTHDYDLKLVWLTSSQVVRAWYLAAALYLRLVTPLEPIKD